MPSCPATILPSGELMKVVGMKGTVEHLGKEVAGRYTGKVKFLRSINRLEPVADPYRIGLDTCRVPIPGIGPNK